MDVPLDDAETLVKLTVDFIVELGGDDGVDHPLPAIVDPWYQYGMI